MCSLQFVGYVRSISIRLFFFFFSSRRRHTRFDCDWSSDVCSSDLILYAWGNHDLLGWRNVEEVVIAPGIEDRHPSRLEHPPDVAKPSLVGVEVREIGRASCRERG